MRCEVECRSVNTDLTHRRFGRTGLQMPRVVFGATVLGNLFVSLSDEAKRELIREWFTRMPAPIAIDSAGKYGAGLSLEVIGRELDRLGIDPADVIISNKLAWRRIPLTTPEPMFEPGVWIDIHHDAVQEINYDGILRCHEDGCRMLGKYRPQLVSVHDPDEYLDAASDVADRNRRLDDIRGAYRALQELRSAGEVSGVGVGAKNWKVIRELDGHCDFDWVMMANSFTVMNHPPELVEYLDTLAERNVALINSALTHGGFLVGGDFLDYRRVDPNNEADAERLLWREKFTATCARFEASPFDVAVAFGVTHPGVSSVALSTSRPERVQSMIDAATKSLPPGIWSALKDQHLVDADYRYL